MISAGVSCSIGSMKEITMPLQAKALLFDLNCLNVPDSIIEIVLPDGQKAIITAIEKDPESLDLLNPILTLSYEIKKDDSLNSEESEIAQSENLHDLLESLT